MVSKAYANATGPVAACVPSTGEVTRDGAAGAWRAACGHLLSQTGAPLGRPSFGPWVDGLGRTATSPALLVWVTFMLELVVEADVVHPLEHVLVLVSMHDNGAATAAAELLLRTAHESRD